MNAPSVDLEALCGSARRRLLELLASCEDEGDRAVAACPGWTVHDVASHLLGNVEDLIAGRLTGPPSDEQTAAQVERHRGDDLRDMLAQLDAQGPEYDKVMGAFEVWPGLIDLVSHEHDIRGALGTPGNRDSDGVRAAAGALQTFDPPVPLVIETEDGARRLGPASTEPLRLTTTRFEVLRFRMGRRSRHQLEAMHWSSDPSALLDHLVVFSPATNDIVE